MTGDFIASIHVQCCCINILLLFMWLLDEHNEYFSVFLCLQRALGSLDATRKHITLLARYIVICNVKVIRNESNIRDTFGERGQIHALKGRWPRNEWWRSSITAKKWNLQPPFRYPAHWSCHQSTLTLGTISCCSQFTLARHYNGLTL